MLEEKQTPPPPQTQQPHHASTTTTTTITIQPPPTTLLPPPHTTASKLPFRPGKTRKLSPNSTTTTNKKRLVEQQQQHLRCIPRTIARTLSTEGEIGIAIRHLRSVDPLLSRLIDIHVPPTFDSFHPPFLALTKSILYQQLAYKAGSSIYTRFVSLCGGESNVLPDSVLSLTEDQLRQIGISNRKADYLHDLANKYKNGILSDSSILAMDDKSLSTMLTMVKGIGSWSVHMFMIFSLHRPDVLPNGDLGVRKGVQLLYGLEELPRPSQMEHICEKWRPYRSVATWYMWKFAEAKGVPATAAAMVGDTTIQQQQQHPQEPTPQFIDPIRSVINLGAITWSQ